MHFTFSSSCFNLAPRAWAEGEAKRARERAKTLEATRHRWQRQGINKVVVVNVQEDLNVDVTWLSAGNQLVEESVNRTESLMDKLKRKWPIL